MGDKATESGGEVPKPVPNREWATGAGEALSSPNSRLPQLARISHIHLPESTIPSLTITGPGGTEKVGQHAADARSSDRLAADNATGKPPAPERDAAARSAEQQINNESRTAPIQKGEGYFQYLKRMDPNLPDKDAVQQARRLRDLNGGDNHTNLRVGERLDTLTPEVKQHLIDARAREIRAKEAQEGFANGSHKAPQPMEQMGLSKSEISRVMQEKQEAPDKNYKEIISKLGYRSEEQIQRTLNQHTENLRTDKQRHGNTPGVDAEYAHRLKSDWGDSRPEREIAKSLGLSSDDQPGHSMPRYGARTDLLLWKRLNQR